MQSPRVLQLIMDSLRYWVEEMHVDGFRFDLASALARELHAVDRLSAFFDVIRQDPVISRVKLIAEPWDVGPGGYQVGNFPPGWTEWNGTLSRFDPAASGAATPGSSRSWRRAWPAAAISTATRAGCRTRASTSSPRTMASRYADLVSYERQTQRRQRRRESRRRLEQFQLELRRGGPTDEAGIITLRERQRRNLLFTIFVSQGVPMLSGGDELGRTQGGNNNPYCLDDATSWTSWDLDANQHQFRAFVARLAALRAQHPVLTRRTFLGGHRPGVADVAMAAPSGRRGHDRVGLERSRAPRDRRAPRRTGDLRARRARAAHRGRHAAAPLQRSGTTRSRFTFRPARAASRAGNVSSTRDIPTVPSTRAGRVGLDDDGPIGGRGSGL